MLSASPIVTVGLIQSRNRSTPEENLERTLTAASALADQGAQVVATQELFLGPYFCQTEDHAHFKLAEPIPGPTTHALQDLCRKREIVVIASLFERRAPGLYHNSAVVIDADGSLLGPYRKMHIPDDPQFYEKFYFTPGDADPGFQCYSTRYAKIGILICWDQWYPEAARITALKGADILVYPTAIGWLQDEKDAHGATQHDSWETIQRSHAIANGCFVAAINRVGIESSPAGAIEFWGQSFVADPSGRLLTKGPKETEAELLTQIDLSRIDDVRTHWPFLRDRRIDAYQNLTRRYIDES